MPKASGQLEAVRSTCREKVGAGVFSLSLSGPGVSEHWTSHRRHRRSSPPLPGTERARRSSALSTSKPSSRVHPGATQESCLIELFNSLSYPQESGPPRVHPGVIQSYFNELLN